jgi:hypothetical protein
MTAHHCSRGRASHRRAGSGAIRASESLAARAALLFQLRDRAAQISPWRRCTHIGVLCAAHPRRGKGRGVLASVIDPRAGQSAERWSMNSIGRVRLEGGPGCCTTLCDGGANGTGGMLRGGTWIQAFCSAGPAQAGCACVANRESNFVSTIDTAMARSPSMTSSWRSAIP